LKKTAANTWTLDTATYGTGTTTSVGLSLPSIFTVTVSPVTTTGTLTATLANQTANTVFAAPNGVAGTPTFRALVEADIPTLNQNTTGSSGSCSGNAATATTATNVDGGSARIATIRGTDGMIENNSGAYLHIGNWAVGRTDATAVLVNTAYRSDICDGNAATATTATNLSGGTVAATTITATGNITAYFSDMRLKTHLGVIENALDKVNSLEGFYYEPNEVAQALGYEVKREVGVSAQSVQAIMPEIIAPAPIDNKYLTVDYERLVPLLIEAIKELNSKLETLENKYGT
jgi:hypothetical protein